ncbi:MAG: PDZ domain-containing protein [Vicinamibacterales bacterium]
MQRLPAAAIAPLLLATIAVLPCPSPAAESTPATIEHAIARVGPSLVRINVVETGYEGGKEVKNESVGSGVIISPSGYVVTNHHVAGEARRIVCIMSDNEEVEAILVGTDPLSDIAVVQLKGEDQGRVFPSVEFADSDQLQVGQECLAMGNPLALSKAVTRGIVSNTRMVMPGSYQRRGGLTLQGESVGTMVRWLVHDARIFPGNSGGPLVDLQGRVIGINEVTFGLGGAIPANLARDVAQQLIENGRVRRSWLGMEFQPLLKDSGLQGGTLVREVVEGSPASAAGIRSGDILLRLGDIEMTAHFDEEIPLLNQKVASLPVGKTVEAVILREGQQMTDSMTTVERQPLQLPDSELSDWGLTARNLSWLSATELKLEETGGVLVTSIRAAGPAGRSKPPLRRGDVIHEVAGKPINNLQELIDLTQTLTKDRTAPLPAAVRFTRSPEDLVSVVEIGSAPKDRIAADARKAWLPVALQVVTRQLAEQLGDPQLAGVRVTQVYPGTTAERAGLKVGDVIAALDGIDLEGSEPGDEDRFTEQLRQYTIGSTVKLAVVRAGQRSDHEVALERSPKLDREMHRYIDTQFEFTARDIGFFDRVHEGWSQDRTGALVTEVVDGGWAALGELYVGDLVTAVEGMPVENVATLETRLKELSDAKPSRIVLRVLRGIHTWYLQLETTWKPH